MQLGPATHWVRQVGDGLAYDGPCILKCAIMHTFTATDWTDLYDGRDATSGTKFCRLESSVLITRVLNLGDGVRFGRGIYIDADTDTVETTVAFIPFEN